MRYPIRIELYCYTAVEADDEDQALEAALRLNSELYDLSPISARSSGEDLYLHFYPDPDEMALEVLAPDEEG